MLISANGVNLGRLTLEHWRAGFRTRSRLEALAAHFAGVYGIPAGDIFEATAALMFDGEMEAR